MAKVLCLITECKFCGRKSSVYQRANGQPLYNCKREYIVLDTPYDTDGVIRNEVGILPSCKNFESKEE